MNEDDLKQIGLPMGPRKISSSSSVAASLSSEEDFSSLSSIQIRNSTAISESNIACDFEALNISDSSDEKSHDTDSDNNEELIDVDLEVENVNQNGTRTLVFGNYLFYKHQLNQDKSILWRFKNTGCKSSVTISDDFIIKRYSTRHLDDHPPLDDNEVEVLKAKDRMTTRTETESIGLKDIYNQEVDKLVTLIGYQEVARLMPSYEKIHSMLYYRRRKKTPVLSTIYCSCSFQRKKCYQQHLFL